MKWLILMVVCCLFIFIIVDIAMRACGRGSRGSYRSSGDSGSFWDSVGDSFGGDGGGDGGGGGD